MKEKDEKIFQIHSDQAARTSVKPSRLVDGLMVERLPNINMYMQVFLRKKPMTDVAPGGRALYVTLLPHPGIVFITRSASCRACAGGENRL